MGDLEFMNKETAVEAYAHVERENEKLRAELASARAEVEQMAGVARHYQKQLQGAQVKLAAMKLVLSAPYLDSDV